MGPLNGKNVVQVIGRFGPGDEFLGGSGLILRSLGQEFQGRGGNLKVIVDGYVPMSPKGMRTWTRDGLEVHKFPLLRSMPEHVHPLGRARRRQFIAGLAFRKIVRLTRPDLVHFHLHPNALLRLALAFKEKTGAKVVFTTHGLDPRFHRHGSYRDVPCFPRWAESVESVDIWVPCGPVDRAGLLDWGIEEGKIFPNYNGVKVPDMLPEAKGPGSDGGDLKIVYAGRIIERKGILDLAEAMASLSAAGPGRKYCLTMAGEGPEDVRRRIIQILAPAGHNVKIDFRGLLDEDGVRDLLLSSHIFCYPTKSPHEGLPLSILEAGAYGCPMVLSDHESHLAVYKRDVHAAFFKKADAGQLAEILIDLVNDRDKQIALRRNAYTLVKEKYNIRRMLSEYMDLYADFFPGGEGS
jgi:glycosyltransferase involved in cell wall biosynthesis